MAILGCCVANVLPFSLGGGGGGSLCGSHLEDILCSAICILVFYPPLGLHPRPPPSSFVLFCHLFSLLLLFPSFSSCSSSCVIFWSPSDGLALTLVRSRMWPRIPDGPHSEGGIPFLSSLPPLYPRLRDICLGGGNRSECVATIQWQGAHPRCTRPEFIDIPSFGQSLLPMWVQWCDCLYRAAYNVVIFEYSFESVLFFCLLIYV